MPFPITEAEIQKTEKKLGLIFPTFFRNAMMAENGGALFKDEDEDEIEWWELYPFFDSSDKKRISRTCNDIIKETEYAKKKEDFPKNAVAIAHNGGGDLLFLLPSENDPKKLEEKIFVFWHEGGIEPFAESFEQLSRE